MSNHEVVKVEDNPNFKWGIMKGTARFNKNIRFYDSFTYNGVEYHLYDCAVYYREGDLETSIGKLVKLYETSERERKVKVLWFFRPTEIRNFLGDDKPHWNEIFLASGEGEGLSNINPLEAVIGKCNVVCTSKDERNPPASEAELRAADYIFYRTFDVGKLTISEKFADKIEGIKVEHFFNRKNDHKRIGSTKVEGNIEEWTKKSSLPSKLGLDRVVQNALRDCKSDCLLRPLVKESKKSAACVREQSNIQPYKKRKLLEHDGSSSQNMAPPEGKNLDGLGKRTIGKSVPQLPRSNGVKTDSKCFVVTQRPDAERRKWFNLPWEPRLERARESDTLVLLDNLDPSYTSSEVEDIIWCALNERVDAKMIQHGTFSSPHNGKAFVIFKSKDAADRALSQLRRRGLMLADRRPLLARRTQLQLGQSDGFLGHLTIDRSKPQRQREEMRNAVSTSHSAQPNTTEYEMAIDWQELQKKSDLWWRALHERQEKEMKDLMNQLKDKSS